MWDETAYPFPNFWEWISNFIPQFIRHVITYPCWDSNSTMLVKGAPGVAFIVVCPYRWVDARKSPLLTYWSYIYLALTHQYMVVAQFTNETVESPYNTSITKYFIRQMTPIPHPHMWAMECLLWVIWRKTVLLYRDLTVIIFSQSASSAETRIFWKN